MINKYKSLLNLVLFYFIIFISKLQNQSSAFNSLINVIFFGSFSSISFLGFCFFFVFFFLFLQGSSYSSSNSTILRLDFSKIYKFTSPLYIKKSIPVFLELSKIHSIFILYLLIII